MKKIVFFILMFLSANLFSQDFTKSFDYLKYIQDKQVEIAQTIWDYTSAKAHSKRDKKVERKREDVLDAIKKSTKDIQKMPAFDGSTDLRDSMVNYFMAMEKMMNGDYVELELLQFEAELSYQSMNKYLQKADLVEKKLSEKSENISKLFDDFANANNISIEKSTSKLAAKITLSTIVNDYYNSVFIINFRAYIAEAFANKAIVNEDTTSLKMWTDSLIYIYDFGAKELSKISTYNNDGTLKIACQKSLNHIKILANNNLPKILNYFRTKAELEKVKKEFNLIPEKNRTQSDIDKYNNTIKKHNNSIVEYNNTIKTINEKSNENSEQWNKAVETFLSKHIPK